ncbi:GNAT family N-acetyltransferase [Burkholderia sp. FERM BP-3421]|jgi:GNAT superfamily N-acetyltransferase|uniref:GNAT family N-acetyltransferase n=1 Tax=Burkholderia sp. FERM BP-3421 TaxID=1494466 RepID=UPI00235DFABA|nr:GNAT family N-acetyltransferase [Burkholderia sp. FERM BP-3421]WDD92486.1 GNAT family N-acetyltransferase [Burkholderia sp. FERM BP-3421]
MDDAAFAAYRADTLNHYAADTLRADGGTAEEAAAREEESLLKLLPDGVRTPSQHLFVLVDPDADEPVGYLWLGRTQTLRGESGFIYDLFVQPNHRGNGYGTQALHAAEAWARDAGLRQLGLHVFGHNEGALRLYGRLGYQATHVEMSKPLGD